MQPNSQRGETSIKIGDKEHTFAVTLGGLAAVEDVLGITKPSEMNEALQMASNTNTAKLLAALINHHAGKEVVTVEEILRSPLARFEVKRALEEAIILTADPEEVAKAREGNVLGGELEAIREEMIGLAARMGQLRGQLGGS